MNVREIAKLANVSIATVSRVINRPEAVLPKTREQVLAVMREYHYQPGQYRLEGREKHSTIAFFVPSVLDATMIRMMEGIENVASNRNYTVYFSSTGSRPQQELKMINNAMAMGVEGIILWPTALDLQTVEELNLKKYPFVFVDGERRLQSLNTCYINYEEGSYRMTRHLLELGRRRICILLGGEAGRMGEEMEKGARRACGEWESETGEICVLRAERGKDAEAGYRAAKELLRKAPPLPDALFASSDELAAGVMKGLKEEQIEIPGDVAVTGFSDSPVSTLVMPELTTVEQPAHRLGMVAARMLFDLIDDRELLEESPQEIVLVPKLKIRSSCGNQRPINVLYE